MANLFNHAYPYLDEHELNLDWLIAKMKELNIAFDEFKVVNHITFSGQWDITKQYPAWTIVSDNNIGYVSIQPVPVGVVLTNTDYWVEVIDYTAQIAGLQSRVIALENTVGDASSGLVHDVDELQTDVAELKKPRKFVIIGDSYSEYNAWQQYIGDYTSEYVVGTDIFTEAQGGAGFTANLYRSFDDCLTDSQATIEAAGLTVNDITDVIFMGGINDSGTAVTTNQTNANLTVAHARTLYPKATIYIAPVTTSGHASARRNIEINVLPAYSNVPNTIYLAQGVRVIVAYDELQTDNTHPNTNGMKLIAKYFVEAVIKHNDCMLPRYYNTGIVAKPGFTIDGNTIMSCVSGNSVHIDFSGAGVGLGGTTYTLNNDLDINFGKITGPIAVLGTLLSSLYQTQYFPVTLRLYHAPDYVLSQGYLYFERADNDTDVEVHLAFKYGIPFQLTFTGLLITPASWDIHF